jgi:FtsP/CotA-like multicopper oxidase with cupredoxin domain
LDIGLSLMALEVPLCKCWNNGSTNIPPNDSGYKDVVFLPPSSSVKLMVKMTDYSDAYSPYMYHCHVLEHEDDGMMGQFLVV